MSPLMVLFGRASRANQCPVSGVKQPCRRNLETAEFDPLPPSAIQSSCVAVFLFDQLVRAQQDRCRHIEAKLKDAVVDRLKPSLFVTGSTPATFAAKQASKTIAIDVGGGAASWPIWSGPY